MKTQKAFQKEEGSVHSAHLLCMWSQLAAWQGQVAATGRERWEESTKAWGLPVARQSLNSVKESCWIPPWDHTAMIQLLGCFSAIKHPDSLFQTTGGLL